jgi:ribosomal protein L32
MSIAEALKKKLETTKKDIESLAVELKADDELQSNRLSLCMSCEHLFKPTSSCKKCGCFVKAKTWIKNAKCPLDKW